MTATAPIVSGSVPTQSTRPAAVLATVNIPVAVWAGGERLAAGTYKVRPAGTLPAFLEGAKPCGSCWVEFALDDVAIARELASILPEAESERLFKGPRPERNGFRIDLLQNGSYVRVWINRDGKDYIISLPTAP
jgi:hypothetical protein